MDTPDGAISDSNSDQPDRHRLNEPMPRENPNGHKDNPAPVPTGCPPSAPRPKHAQTGIYVNAPPGLRIRDKNVERLARKVRNLMPWLERGDFPLVRAWAEHEYLCGQVYAALRALGVLNEKKEVRRLYHDYRQMRAAQLQIAAALGMTPTARVQLQATSAHVALDLAENVSKRAVEMADARHAEAVVEVVEDGNGGIESSLE